MDYRSSLFLFYCTEIVAINKNTSHETILTKTAKLKLFLTLKVEVFEFIILSLQHSNLQYMCLVLSHFHQVEDIGPILGLIAYIGPPKNRSFSPRILKEKS
jgi:hypothetical protein